MPGFDATGPMGQGSMTGWGRGRCQGDAQGTPPLSFGRGGFQGRGYFQGRGGRGCRRGFGAGGGRGFGPGGQFAGRGQSVGAAPVATPTSDLEALRREAEACAQNLERINARISALEAKPEADPQAGPTE